MFQIQNHQPDGRRRTGHRNTTVRLAVAAASVALVLGPGAGPVAARPDAGNPVTVDSHSGGCVLTRVGQQYTRCDFLTGNGVPAPAWVHER